MNAGAPISRSNSLGFTLIEVLMAMSVLTVGLLGLLQSLQLGYRQNLRDRMRNEAVQVAEEQMHDLRRIPFDEIVGFKRDIPKKIGGREMPFEAAGTVDDIGSTGSTARPAKKLRVTVSWTVHGERFNHEIFTVRTRRSDE
ncbi:type IV pilus minor pilin PilV [Citrifermentans bemidjiense Bem]|uniref:Type IV pilus minor pilin PilV n=1 Tax=Citrifermentans bemidjiense (strain ATCC BAA-1014 / DSM 16622 / JCM 12645 / Bem) TaxID=404380 RepID=B5E8H5_CITBB|nr:prepilin-type N-terminal cleavage/methylation domain-containing protein [Citrifermentans bemidjiense]ACH38560.2 type IV pilus minor pilin PilV [Citrifermentans bemidjiense Bem]